MSRSNEIVCKTCGEYLTIGQSDFIYSGEEDTMEGLNTFLEKHKTHSKAEEHELLYMSEVYNGEYEDEPWQDVDALNPKEQ